MRKPKAIPISMWSLKAKRDMQWKKKIRLNTRIFFVNKIQNLMNLKEELLKEELLKEIIIKLI